MCDVNAEAKVYIRQDDGSLRPLELPEDLARRVVIYEALTARGLSHEQIRFLVEASLWGCSMRG